jgi:hypothetical protein
MANNIFQFRRIKWGDPKPKLKVLVEDFQRRIWLDRLSPRAFWLLICFAAVTTFVAINAAGKQFR